MKKLTGRITSYYWPRNTHEAGGMFKPVLILGVSDKIVNRILPQLQRMDATTLIFIKKMTYKSTWNSNLNCTRTDNKQLEDLD